MFKDAKISDIFKKKRKNDITDITALFIVYVCGGSVLSFLFFFYFI